jgi:hypothetical protein
LIEKGIIWLQKHALSLTTMNEWNDIMRERKLLLSQQNCATVDGISQKLFNWLVVKIVMPK